MTAATLVDVRYRQERGWDDPGYPIGIWRAGAIVNGDASGGLRVVQVNLRTFTGLPIGNAWSLEHITAFDTEPTPKNLMLTVSGVEAAIDGTRHSWVVPMVLPNAEANTMLGPDGQGGLPLFLGVAISPLAAAAVLFTLANDDGENLSVTCEGYFWSPRSVLKAPGGFRRPVDGMFGVGRA